jgi:ABC-type phosphate transport system substrate-binding protein
MTFSKPDTENANQVAGGIVPVYNVPVLDPSDPAQTLVLDRQTLAYIFIGNITVWNDQRILDLQNPVVKKKLGDAGVPTPQKITVVVRSDGSGSTEVLTKALDM